METSCFKFYPYSEGMGEKAEVLLAHVWFLEPD